MRIVLSGLVVALIGAGGVWLGTCFIDMEWVPVFAAGIAARQLRQVMLLMFLVWAMMGIALGLIRQEK